jgi:hypothetical protein
MATLHAFKNNSIGLVQNNPLSNVGTNLIVNNSLDTKLQSLPQFYWLTLWHVGTTPNTDPLMEIVLVTARVSPNNYTITRAQQGTSAQQFNLNDNVALLWTAGNAAEVIDYTDAVGLGSLIVYNAIQQPKIFPAGTNGQVPIYDNTQPTGFNYFTPPSSTGFQFATPGTYDWVCPVGVTSVTVDIVGGGGGGAATEGSGGYSAGSGGGGADGALGVTSTVVPLTVYTVVVGAGGAGGTTSGAVGVAGGTSSFNGISKTGGSGGTITFGGTSAGGAAGGATAGAGGTGGFGSNGGNGATGTGGGTGGTGGLALGESGGGGGGASGLGTTGGNGGAGNSSGSSGVNGAAGTAGAGGGGGGIPSSGAGHGGNGGAGFIILHY